MKFNYFIAFIFCITFCAFVTKTHEFKKENANINLKSTELPEPKEIRQSTKPILLNVSQVSAAFEANFPKLNINLINRADPSQSISFQFLNLLSILSHPWFDNKQPTVIYIFGFAETQMDATTKAVLKAYSTRGGHNIIVIDWSFYNGKKAPDDFEYAVANMKLIGDLVGRRLYTTFGYTNLKRFHLVGFSIGAHMAGYINRGIRSERFPVRIPKIIGLDPFGPLMYEPVSINQPLSALDAINVQIIHTDMTGFGAPFKSGTVDFYPNGGGVNGIQPGCPIFDVVNRFNPANFCSHKLSVFLYAESVASSSSETFKAIQCISYVDFLLNNCSKKTAQMGFSATDSDVGEFYLQTSSREPYSRDSSGVTYDINAI